MSTKRANAEWQERREFGNRVATKYAVRLVSWGGRRVAHAAMIIVAGYYFVSRPMERAASRDYLSRVLPHPVRKRDVFKHFLTFAYVNVDRIFFLTRDSDYVPTEFIGRKALFASVDEGRGGLFLAAHFGSFEAARTIAAHGGRARVRIVIHRRLNANLLEELASLNPEFSANMIDAEQSPAALGIEIAEAVQQGDWVGFLVDRHMEGARTISCQLLDESVQFAQGPFAIAAALKLPIYAIFAPYTYDKYRVTCCQISPKLDLERGARARGIQLAAQSFATLLEEQMRDAPYSWFNFYDFWASE